MAGEIAFLKSVKLSEKVRAFIIANDLESAAEVIAEASVNNEFAGYPLNGELDAARRLWLSAFSSIWDKEPVPLPPPSGTEGSVGGLRHRFADADLRLKMIGSLQIEAVSNLLAVVKELSKHPELVKELTEVADALEKELLAVQKERDEAYQMVKEAVTKERKRCADIVARCFTPGQGEEMDRWAVSAIQAINFGDTNG